MAAVLQFDNRLKRERPQPMAAGATAQIIIFNGVRFERLDRGADFEKTSSDTTLLSQATS